MAYGNVKMVTSWTGQQVTRSRKTVWPTMTDVEQMNVNRWTRAVAVTRRVAVSMLWEGKEEITEARPVLPVLK